MIVGLLLFLIFALVFTTIQTLLLRKEGSDSKTYAKEQLENLKKGRHFQEFVYFCKRWNPGIPVVSV